MSSEEIPSMCDCCGEVTEELVCSGYGCLCPSCQKNYINCQEWGIPYVR
jgi:hypothetical protein